ncbi:hypothetical protein FDECE_15435 [Fusarium decemcellulare]|nr:hypothetical protein FDECE_15435 [Fusarium decemcellulare]
MSCPVQHPDEFHVPGWDEEAKRPIVDGKYNDPKTGELRTAAGYEYSGPPAVDIVVTSLHEDTTQCVYRAQRPFPVEKMLHQVMKVVHDRSLTIDSLIATTYHIRIVLAHEITPEEFSQISDEMANGIWNQA